MKTLFSIGSICSKKKSVIQNSKSNKENTIGKRFMISYQTLKNINYLHDQLHLNNPDLKNDKLQERQPD